MEQAIICSQTASPQRVVPLILTLLLTGLTPLPGSWSRPRPASPCL